MFSKKYMDEIKKDQELAALRKEYYDLTGKPAGIDLMNPLPVSEWKKRLHEEIVELKREQ
ncbi:hypothetical protein [Lacrimispora sp. 210928-DFI.3.58]|uniref:hypothetical protein n=1 Tax=Lacrimispora sp. 210928-DFI.3.58 TaxID=2883214 RepID=UPI001D074535|nr:hypothetical protein [Lacrimispora sp. 210928-DFI.3.58]MCB7320785.1 hypothetical protein [Lacrimispora sp. 210928-DFI.3.58]